MQRFENLNRRLVKLESRLEDLPEVAVKATVSMERVAEALRKMEEMMTQAENKLEALWQQRLQSGAATKEEGG